jgi:hypothetical protein
MMRPGQQRIYEITMTLTKALYNKYVAGVNPQHTAEPPANASPAQMAEWHRWKKLYDAGKTGLLFDEWNNRKKQKK